MFPKLHMKYKPAGIVLIIRDDGATEVLVGPETFWLGNCPFDDTISSPVISSITVVMKGWTILTVCTWLIPDKEMEDFGKMGLAVTVVDIFPLLLTDLITRLDEFSGTTVGKLLLLAGPMPCSVFLWISSIQSKDLNEHKSQSMFISCSVWQCWKSVCSSVKGFWQV